MIQKLERGWQLNRFKVFFFNRKVFRRKIKFSVGFVWYKFKLKIRARETERKNDRALHQLKFESLKEGKRASKTVCLFRFHAETAKQFLKNLS